MTLKLYGAPLSNYFNMVKTALLEKGVAFEEVMTAPSQEPDYLSKSPMGKIPTLETDEGYVSETLAILGYLEEVFPQPALLPTDAFARAKVRELALSLGREFHRLGLGSLSTMDFLIVFMLDSR